MTPRLGRALLAIPIIVRTYGGRGLARRVLHETRRSGGLFRVRPSLARLDAPPPRQSPYRPTGSWPAERAQTALERGSKVVDGSYEAFGHEWRPFPAGAREWATHIRTGYTFPDRPWWRIPLMPAEADIKDVWEPARFGWAYDLVRAYAVSGDESFARAFHDRLRSWMDACPPFRGVHWACGQETTIRALAVLHAEAGLPLPVGQESEAATRIATVLAWSGERIMNAIGYGLSQRNNHGISESCGLIHLGLRLRGVHADAEAWTAAGVRLLEEQIADQFAPDGWYAQHSFTYSRVALEQVLHAIRVLASRGMSLSHASLARIDAGTVLLEKLVDSRTGRVPNHGANDGSRAVPLSVAQYRDFRPLLTLAAIVRRRPMPCDLPADPDVVAWTGNTPQSGPPRVDGCWTGSSGWAAARVKRTAVFMRAGSYRHRPSHIDPLHIDVRFDGVEVVTDAGTYAYNAPRPWANGLAGASVHNGPVLAGRTIAERGPRFLWYSWPSARVLDAGYLDGEARIVAEMPGLVARDVKVSADKVVVTDRVLDASAPSARVTWLVHPDVVSSYRIDATGAQVVRASESDVTAWFSPSYGLRIPTVALLIESAGARGDSLQTIIHAPGSGASPA